MTESMNQLISIFADIIKANDFITFAYSSLNDRWYYLGMKGPFCYECIEAVENVKEAYAYMLEECYYYWLERNHLINPDLSTKATIESLSPEIRSLLDAFLEPYVKAAEKFL